MKKLIKALEYMSIDNGTILKPVPFWPTKIPYKTINDELEKLNDSELQTFIFGEYDDVQNLIQKYNLHLLDAFFNSCFDGPWHYLFFYEF